MNSWRRGTTTLANPATALAVSVGFDDASIRVSLTDGREISEPLAWFPRLRDANPERRANWRPIGPGEGIHWPDIDEVVSANALLGLPT